MKYIPAILLLTLVSICNAAWDKGFNFRCTAAFVTDGTNQTYVLTGTGSCGAFDSYPTTRNGVTFGWTTSLGADNGRDRSNTVDVRLAGINFGDFAHTFQVDLPATGDYVITLAMGDQGNNQTGQVVEFFDNTTSLVRLPATGHETSNDFRDATNVNRTTAAWPGSNVTITKTFATTTFKATFGDGTANWAVAHIFLSQVANTSIKNIIGHGIIPFPR